MNNMVAYTLTIPATWNFQGAVLVDPGCGATPTTVAYRVFTDDLRYGVQRMPEVSWYTPLRPPHHRRQILQEARRCQCNPVRRHDHAHPAAELEARQHLPRPTGRRPRRIRQADGAVPQRQCQSPRYATLKVRLGTPRSSVSNTTSALSLKKSFLQVMEQTQRRPLVHDRQPPRPDSAHPVRLQQAHHRLDRRGNAPPKGQLDASRAKTRGRFAARSPSIQPGIRPWET